MSFINSLKALNNIPTEPDFANVNIVALFMSKSNMSLLSHNLYKIARQNGDRNEYERFAYAIPLLAKKFQINNNLFDYTTAESEAIKMNNWVEVLKTINNDFMKYCYKYIKWNQFVPTREWAEVGSRNDRKQKRFQYFNSEDAKTLDLWRNQETQIMNKHFRYENKIPFWQVTMHTRHYDRSNEGLMYDDPERASLENPIYGYDMTAINSTLNNWKSSEWFGM